MQRARGVADENAARRHLTLRAYQRQRIRRPLADPGEAPQAPSEDSLKPAEKLAVRAAEQRILRACRDGHHHCITRLTQRQQCKGTGWRKPLESGALARARSDHVRHDSHLTVGVFGEAHTEALCQCPTARGNGQQSGAQRLPAGHDGQTVLGEANVFDHRIHQCEVARGRQRIGKRRLQAVVLQHVAERGQGVLDCAQAGRTEVAAIGYVNRLDGRGEGAQRRPQSEAVEQAARALVDGGRANVHRRRRLRRETLVDHGDAAAIAAERQRQTGTDHAAARDDYVEVPLLHAAISSSISSGSLGASRLSTSRPSRVTTTSSSIRMPMFCNAFGTPRAGVM